MILDYEMNFHIIICLQSEFIRTDWFKWNLENKKVKWHRFHQKLEAQLVWLVQACDLPLD